MSTANPIRSSEVPALPAAPLHSGVASELNNLLQIISGTSSLLENIWAGNPDSEKYFAMLQSSVARAEKITTELVRQSGGMEPKILLHPELEAFNRRPATPPNSKSRRKPRVMMVDDEEAITTLGSHTLTDAGFEVVTAASGFECLDLFRQHKGDYQLILLDLSMPVLNGEETFERLRVIAPEVPVVVTTGYVDKERLDRMVAKGLAGYLRKPHRSSDLALYAHATIESFQLARAKAGKMIALDSD